MLTRVDSLAYVKKQPERFFRAGSATGVEVAEIIAGDALRLTDGPVTVVHGRVVGCCRRQGLDRKSGGPVPGRSVLADRPFPQAGPNSMHGEVLLTAFATQVVTACGCETRVLRGTVADDDPAWQALRADPLWKRVIAFRGV